MAFQRTGSCEKCGQCCGAEGSPNQESPWPKNMFFIIVTGNTNIGKKGLAT